MIGSALAAAACAAVLAIDDRELAIPDALPPREDVAVDPNDGAIGDAGTDGTASTCDPGCADAGGSCDASTCVIDCTRGCTDPVTCPTSGACHVVCGDGGCSTGVTCKNEVGCKIDCAGDFACHRGVTCEAPTCEIACTGPNACRNDPGISCDASICKVTCSGNSSCNRQILANASVGCDIDCLGSPSCTNGRVQCISPDASIRCDAINACNNGRPWCAPPDSGALEAGTPGLAGACAITCGPDTTSCVPSYCCQSATCTVVVDSGVRTNICP